MANKRKCRQCGDYGKSEDMLIVPLGAFCDSVCASIYGHATRHKGYQKKAKEQRAKDRAWKKANPYRKKPQTNENHQQWTHAYIRLRDFFKDCPSCDRPWNDHSVGWDAGHWRSRGAASHLAMNTLNIHKQCRQCNRPGIYGQKTNITESIKERFDRSVRERIGSELAERLLCDNAPRSFSAEYKARITRIMKRKAAKQAKKVLASDSSNDQHIPEYVLKELRK